MALAIQKEENLPPVKRLKPATLPASPRKVILQKTFPNNKKRLQHHPTVATFKTTYHRLLHKHGRHRAFSNLIGSSNRRHLHPVLLA